MNVEYKVTWNMRRTNDMNTTHQVDVQMSLPVVVVNKGGYFVATCPALDVVSQGETKKEAIENIKEALNVFLTTCFEMGTIDAVMKECGFSVQEGTIPSRTRVRKSQSVIHVPIPFSVLKHAQNPTSEVANP